VVIMCQIRARFAATPPALELGQGGIAKRFRELALPLVAVMEVDQRGADRRASRSFLRRPARADDQDSLQAAR